MKFTSYETGGKAHYGLVIGDNKLTTAQGELAQKYPDLKAVIAADALAEVGKALSGQSPDTDMESVSGL